jgi:hypothetical protein
MRAAWARAGATRAEARRLNELGHHAVAYVWAVRSAEILLRDFVLAPHFIELGDDWDKAMRRGSSELGSSNWKGAFSKAEEWYGPFDTPMTEGDENAWAVWTSRVVRRRGDLVHGSPVHEPDREEARDAIAFSERMATWYAQRLTTSERHPAGKAFREVLERSFGDAWSKPGDQAG